MKAPSKGIVVVTGASGGIGRATASRLADEGYGVIAHYHTRHDAAESLRAKITSSGGACWLLQANLARPDGVEVLSGGVADVLDALPGSELRGLVNNAALLLGPSFSAASVEQFDAYFAVNTRAPFFLSQALSQLMCTGGSIVNVSSAGAHFSSAGDIVYAMSKTAVESLTKNAAEALAERGIRINAVMPGFTDNGHGAFNNARVRAYMADYSVLGDVSAPETVAEAIVFLLSDRANRTTGSILDVSGGSVLGVRPRSDSSISLRQVYEADDRP